MKQLGLTAALVVALAISGYAQKKPDFSGTWALDQTATDAANAAAATPPAGGGGGGGGRGMGGPITIKQTADTLSIERAGRGGTPTTTTYKLDGTEQEIAQGQMTIKAKAKWDGDKIVIESTRPGQDGTPMTSTMTYTLDKDGNLWTENKTANGTRKVAYKKST